MPAAPEYQTNRTAEYSARNFLREAGYEVVRVTERHSCTESPFHLIAWNRREELLFIRVGTSRIWESVPLQEEIHQLSAPVRSGRYPGEIQYWMSEGDHWRRYRIFSGGAVQITGADCDII
jgi:hypothetical protein